KMRPSISSMDPGMFGMGDLLGRKDHQTIRAYSPPGVKPLIHHDILKLVIEFLGDELSGFKRALGWTRKDQIGRHLALCQALTHFRSVAFAAVVQRSVFVLQCRFVPARLGMANKEQCFHGGSIWISACARRARAATYFPARSARSDGAGCRSRSRRLARSTSAVSWTVPQAFP